METQDEVYRKLRREIDKLPIPYPETESGVEIRLLKYLFSPEEAGIALNLNILPENLERIHGRAQKNGIDISAEELEEKLDGLVNKGAIVGGRYFESKGKGKLYNLAPLVIGMFEFQVDRLTKTYVRDFESYLDEKFRDQIFQVETRQLRTVPVNISMKPELRIETCMNMREYVGKIKGDIAVANCVCHQSSDVIDKRCRHSDILETCLMFHDAARFAMGRGVGRQITNEEALSIMERAERAGFVFNSQNSQEPQFLCCCNSDCCHVLRGLKMYPRPAEMIHSNYSMTIDRSRCRGCGKCAETCPMDAISMKDKKAVVDLDCCIGCNVCDAACKNDAHFLGEKDTVYVPPKNRDELFKKIMVERFGMDEVVKIATKYFAGEKA